MKAEHKQLAERWLKQAEIDLEDAKYLFRVAGYHLVCFMSQQASEKALKAFLFSQGAETVWGHSASELCVDASRYDEDFLDFSILPYCLTHSTFLRVTLTRCLKGFQQVFLFL